jgi:transcriptional regulator with XRE-family HTH domain
MANGKYQPWIEPDGLLRLAAWARDGLTDEQIAAKIGVTRATLYNWKNDHIDIFDALKRGKEVVDIMVENALYRNAVGYEYEEDVPFKVREEKQRDGQKLVTERVEVVKVKKIMPGQTTAQLAWLNNRKPDKWRQRQLEAAVADADAAGRKLANIADLINNPAPDRMIP